MAATDALLRAALERDPSGPLVTYYDDLSGERTELSATTLDNWVAKTANLLRDDLDVQPEDWVAVMLPAHWQTTAVLLAAWSCGAVLTAEPADAVEVAFVAASDLGPVDWAAQVVGLSLLPLGQGLPKPVPGVVDFALEVRMHGDEFRPFPVEDDAPALAGDGRTIGADELVAQIRTRAVELGIGPGDRVLSALRWRGIRDWIDGWLAPLAAGASVVLCPFPRGPWGDRARAERVSATLGLDIPGLPRLDGQTPGTSVGPHGEVSPHMP